MRPISLVTIVCLGVGGLPVLFNEAAGQCIDCSGYSVRVTPDGVSTPSRPPNTVGHSAVFTIENTGTSADTYTITCAGSSNVTCTGTSTGSAFLNSSGVTTVTAYYNVGVPGIGTVSLTATSINAGNSFDTGTFTVPVVGAQGVAVTPDAGTGPDRPAHTNGYSQAFTVQNTSPTAATFTITCAGSANVTCTSTSPTSVTLGIGGSQSVTAFYNVSNGGTASLTLTATRTTSPNPADAGSIGFIVTLPAGAPRVDASVYNPGDQDYTACAVSCFAAVYAQSTVPYVSLDAPRNVTLVYNSDRHQPRPFVHVNVERDPGYGSTPSQYRLEVKVNGVSTTFLNGEQTLRFAYDSVPRRIGGQFDATSYATGVYPMDIVVSAVYPDSSLIATVTSTKLVVVNENPSSIAAGWTLAGVQRVYQATDGSALLTTGDGSSVFFQKSSGVDPFIAPLGEFSRLLLGTPSGASGWTRVFVDSTRIVFDSLGRMTEVRDRLNNVNTVIYDGNGRVSQLKDPLNLSITLGYNGNGLATITDPGSRVTTVIVDASRRLTSIRDPDNVGTTFGYDGSLRLQTITNRRNTTTTLGYDTQSSKLSTVTPPAVEVVEPGGSISTASPVTAFSPWQKVGIPYGSTGTPVLAPRADTVYGRVTDPGGHVTRYTVNRWGTPQQTRDTLGYTTTVSFGANGLPIRVVHPTGATDSLAYNNDGLPTYVRAAGKDSATYLRYAGWGQADSVWGYQQPSVRAFVGTSGRVDSTRTWGAAGASVTRIVYETRGRVERVTDGESHLATRTWFAGVNGNRSKDSLPGNRIKTYGYDTHGRTTSVSASGVSTRFTAYDVLNRVLKDSTAGYAPIVYAYDSLLLKTVTDPKGQIYRFAYNALGWTVARTDPANHADTLRYDRDGLLRLWKNRRFQTVAYEYDVGHRASRKLGTNADTTKWTYSSNGLTVGAISPWAVDSHFFSIGGALDSVRTRLGTQTFTHRFRYLKGGQLDSVEVTGGGITFTARKYLWRTAAGTLDSIRLAGGGKTALLRNRDGQLTATTLPGGDAISRVFTAVHAEAQISTTASESTTVNRYLNYDGAGRITRLVFGNGISGRAFYYDGLGRLAADSQIRDEGPDNPCAEPNIVDENGNQCTYIGSWVTVPSGSVSFGYDAAGNRSDQGGDYGPANRIRQLSGCTYATDSLGDGNVLSRTCGSETIRFWWTAESRLAALKVVGGDSIDFRYDASGRLVRKDVNTVPQAYFLWQGDNLFAELSGAATSKVGEYSYYPGLDSPHAVITGTTPNFAHVDGLGNVIALTDSAKNVQRTYDYDAWGGLRGGSDSKPFLNADRPRFKGALWLGPQLDMYFMRARWYEPKSGRFLSEDPKGLAGGLNPYIYGQDDPVNGRDPSGTETCIMLIVDDVEIPCNDPAYGAWLKAADAWFRKNYGFGIRNAFVGASDDCRFSGAGRMFCASISQQLCSMIQKAPFPEAMADVWRRGLIGHGNGAAAETFGWITYRPTFPFPLQYVPDPAIGDSTMVTPQLLPDFRIWGMHPHFGEDVPQPDLQDFLFAASRDIGMIWIGEHFAYVSPLAETGEYAICPITHAAP